jgi:hypothetical protein
MAWSRAFDDPIRVSGGRVQEAGHYATARPKAAHHERTEWQTAAEC